MSRCMNGVLSRVMSGAALCAALVLPFNSHGLDLTPDGASASYGKNLSNKANISNTRMSLRWNWDKDFLPNSSSLRLDGYFDLGFSNWRSHLSAKDQPSPDGAGKAWAVGFSPVFRLQPKSSSSVIPFLDFGVGASYQSEKNLEKKLKSPINMGGHTQFEIRTVAGIQFGAKHQYEVAYGWFHYSNANLHPQNEAIDFQVLSFTLNW